MAKSKTIYVCNNCGASSPRWSGKCSECGSWNTITEEIVDNRSAKTNTSLKYNVKPISEISGKDYSRTKTNIQELDRVLGGGIVTGSVILIGGDPGIGKSTLMLQVANNIADKKLLYVAGEESPYQIKMRSDRLNYNLENFFILPETNLEVIENAIEAEEPDIVIIDSIQTVYNPAFESASGTVSQLRECTSRLSRIAKKTETALFVIGHITKDGVIAGPKVLEHMVDVVLQFEGERTHSYRVLRSIKNRFGSASEIGIFEMTDKGLNEVNNPSEVFLSQRNYGASGCSISASMEGTRPILIEVQALASHASFGMPQRTAMGFDNKRLNILIAVLEKKLGLVLNKSDVFVNIAGGVKIDEPAIDLAAAMSIYSSFKDIPIDSETVILGEVGLSGEIRTISNMEKRINEAIKLGFKKVILPKNNAKKLQPAKKDVSLIGVEKIKDAVEKLI